MVGGFGVMKSPFDPPFFFLTSHRALKPAQRPPGSHARNYDLSARDLHRTANQGAGLDAVQALAYLTDLFGQVAFTFENDALAVFELRHALPKALPFRCTFQSHFAALEFNTGFCEEAKRRRHGPQGVTKAETAIGRLPIRAEVLAHFIPSFALDSVSVSTAYSTFGGQRYSGDGHHPVPDCPVFSLFKTIAEPATSVLANQLEPRSRSFRHCYIAPLACELCVGSRNDFDFSEPPSPRDPHKGHHCLCG